MPCVRFIPIRRCLRPALLAAAILSTPGEPACASCVTLSWLAPGDDSTLGQAARYEIRVSDEPITEENWSRCRRIAPVPSPLPAGTLQRVVVGDLTPGQTYYFAVKTADEAGNWSPMSDVISVTAPPDYCDGWVGNLDCDPEGRVDIGDVTALVSHLFISFQPICCRAEANIDQDPYGTVDISDLTQLMELLFMNMDAPPPCR